MRLWTVWGRLVWAAGFVCATHALMIKEEDHTDTELYVAPASYTRKNGKALPSTIIISRPLGVHTQSKDHSSEGSFSTDSVEDDSEDSRDKSLDIQHKIKFYTIECTSGRQCTSIIPARTSNTERPTAKPFTNTDIKNYLKQFSLRDGFHYSDDYETSGTPKRPTETERRESERAFGGSTFFDSSDYWPGSEYRPQPLPSKGQVFKYEQYDPTRPSRPTSPSFPGRRPTTNWDKISESFPTRSPAIEWQRVRPIRPGYNNKPFRPQRHRPFQYPPPHQLSHTYLFDDRDDVISIPSTATTPRPAPYDGVWNRYSTSTVSQLDKDTGEWVKISSSNSHIDQGVFKKPTTPQYILPNPSHHAKASLTVLGLSERTPHATFTDHGSQPGPHVMEVPSALPGRPPALIETDGGHVAGLPATGPRVTSSSSSPVSHISVTPAGYAQFSRPFRVRGKFAMEQ
ncbi:uncharacterized protein LOC121856444 [Homarus americanus]|uniref:uncharacterized protein LOC121856444 n=1 Tax=Homarus americanus TaxID=6706 RepID=UPI001C43E951|nr:uncharacterized protein LOC121856444 [Homarus americanus]